MSQTAQVFEARLRESSSRTARESGGLPLGLAFRQAKSSRYLRRFGRSAAAIAVLLASDAIILYLLGAFLVPVAFETLASAGPAAHEFVTAGIVGLVFAGAYKAGDEWRRARRLAEAGLLASVIVTWTLYWGDFASMGEATIVFATVAMTVFVSSAACRGLVWWSVFAREGGEALSGERTLALINGEDPRSSHLLGRVVGKDSGFQVRHVLDIASSGHTGEDFVREELWSQMSEHDLDTFVAIGRMPDFWFETVVEVAALTGIRLLAISRHQRAILRERVVWEGGYPYIELAASRLKGGQVVAKRLIDLVGAAIGLVVLSPFLAAIAAAIKLDSEGPVLFKQIRIGKGGKPFQILKFRTMKVGADADKEHLQDRNCTGDPRFFKIPDDPRVTRLGRFLRTWSLDELPQLWNVLRGDMALVGPRPFPQSDFRNYLDHHYDRLAVRPGITGLWQVAGRSDVTDFEEVVRLDREYIDRWSIWLDFWILLRTLPAVLRKTGAR